MQTQTSPLKDLIVDLYRNFGESGGGGGATTPPASTPPASAPPAVGAPSQATIDDIRAQRMALPLNGLNPWDISFLNQLPSVQNRTFLDLQGKYGIPGEDTRADVARMRPWAGTARQGR